VNDDDQLALLKEIRDILLERRHESAQRWAANLKLWKEQQEREDRQWDEHVKMPVGSDRESRKYAGVWYVLVFALIFIIIALALK